LQLSENVTEKTAILKEGMSGVVLSFRLLEDRVSDERIEVDTKLYRGLVGSLSDKFNFDKGFPTLWNWRSRDGLSVDELWIGDTGLRLNLHRINRAKPKQQSR
jgi:hypothetical protein